MLMESWNLPNSSHQSFIKIPSDDSIATVIKSAFDMDLDVSGGWGYEMRHAIKYQESSLPLPQLQHTLASMRTHLEMSMTQHAEQRYGGINLTEKSRQTTGDFEAVTYQVTAMLESDYADFINAYKEGYGTADFDMEAHFKARKNATLHREIVVWFQPRVSHSS